MEAIKYILLFLFILAITTPTLKAHITDFDEFWQQRAKEANQAAQKTYHPNPEEVNEHLNNQVYKFLKDSNSTRPHINGYNNKSCEAPNPIDKCWRCDNNWAKHRKRLAYCGLGFGRKTRGGKDGDYYVVTDPSDYDVVNPKPGTLRYGVIQNRPLWIIFERDMRINLREELMMTSNKTIDGRGVNVHICFGAQITIQLVSNIIIHGIHIYNIKQGNGGFIRDSVYHYGRRDRSDGDGISICGSTNIWIDHVSMSNCFDGLIDVVEASTAITISNSYFTNHNGVMLFGARKNNPRDSLMQITLAFNHFGPRLVQRMPRVRWGFVHIVNNDYTGWEMYAIGGSEHPTISSQGNRFVASSNPMTKQVTKRDYAVKSEWKRWNWRSEGDLMENGAYFVESGSQINGMGHKDDVFSNPGSHVSRLTRFSGALRCIQNMRC